MRKLFKKFLPGHEAVRDNRWLRPYASSLLHPRLWCLNRRTAAGAVAAGLFCGLIPGPFQMLAAAVCALVFRINLPLAMLITLYTNPLTIVPLYVIAFGLGQWALGERAGAFVPPPEFDWNGFAGWVEKTLAWAIGLGKPLGIGLVLLAALLAAFGYLSVHLGWRGWLLWQYRQRRQRRQRAQPRPK